MDNKFNIILLNLVLIFITISISSQSSLASNGLKLISSGTRAASMGGADIADSIDTSVLNVNPAVITRFDTGRIEIHFGNAFLYNLAHKDQFGDDRVENKTSQLLDISYASKLDHYPIYWGAGLFVTGGLGVEYENINTPFGNQDDLSSLIGLLSFTPALSYKVNSRFSLGASLVAMYINAEQEFFPDTSIANPQTLSQPFFGTRFKNANDFGYGFRAGIQYRINDRFTLGAIYNSQIDLIPTGDNFKLNLSALGLGEVNYNHVRLSGLNFPTEIGLGLKYQPDTKWTFMLDLSWLDWSSSVKRSRLVASNPDNSLAPSNIDNRFDLRWKDQYVFAFGMAYQITPELEVRVGYNYARAPVRKATLSPFLSPHAEHHLGLGVGKTFKSGWSLDFSTLYIFNSKIKYTNPQLPFGADAEEEGETIQFEMTLGYEF